MDCKDTQETAENLDRLQKHTISGCINYDGRTFTTLENSLNGEVSGQTVFHYHQEDRTVWAEYVGGEVSKGFLVGYVDENSCLVFSYQHLNNRQEIRMGLCNSKPELCENGQLIMHETWQWMNGDYSKGNSKLIEITSTSCKL